MDEHEDYSVTPADPRDPGDTFLPEDAVYEHDPGGSHRQRFAGLPIKEWDEAEGCEPDQAAWLVADVSDTSTDATDLPDAMNLLLSRVNPARITAIAVTGFGATNAPKELARYADRLPALRSVFLGFVEAEMWEISWIRQGDITPLLEAYPRLERLEVRGSDGLALQTVTHEHLRVLRFESGGLPGAVIRSLGVSTLPALEHLELWLGVEAYGGDSTAGDLDGILSGVRLPALRRLGLRNSERQDEVAAAVAAAPVVGQLDELSLGMGALSDRGAEALLSGQPLTHLSRLDLRFHFLSDTMAERVRRALPGVDVDLAERQLAEGEDWRYVAVSE